MKVALVCATSARTGVETHLLMLARGLARHGVEARLVCATEGPLVDEFRVRGIEVRLDAPAGRFGGTGLLRLSRSLAGTDLVHAHGPRAISWSALLRTIAPRRPTVATVHQFQASGPQGSLERRAFSALEAWSIGRHDRAIVVSPEIHARLLAAGAIGAGRSTVIPHTVSLLEDRPLTRRAAEPGSLSAVIAARFDPVKGYDVLVEAWGRLHRDGIDLPLTILGDGPDRDALADRARALGLDALVRFAGSVSDVPRWLEAATLYVAPSHYESLGGSVLEAMAIGLPVVATAVPGHLDLLAGTAPEWLVPPGDPVAFAAAVRRMLALPAAERLALGARLQDRAYDAFAPERIVAETLRVYAAAGAGRSAT